MYRIQKVLNNNALLVMDEKEHKESILLGKGIGFAKKAQDRIAASKEFKEYKLVPNERRHETIGTKTGIDPIFLEAAGKIIEAAEEVFDDVSSDILLPLADHIAFAAKREREKIYVPNPFIPDIKVLFGREYAVALKSRDIIKEYAGYEISDDEAGFIALHIHSGLSHEQVSATLKDTTIINQCMQLIEQEFGGEANENSLTYTRLLSHLYYMVVRTRKGEGVNIDLNGFMHEKYQKAMNIAQKICDFMAMQLGLLLDELETGYLAIHIERYIAEATKEKGRNES